jgi:predicted enzyme related to lactoylglutathione lyase
MTIVVAKYVHTNVIAMDWRKLASFYQKVFGCEVIPPERDLSGQCINDATGLPNAHIRGVHLRLPGFGTDGPTLEIFSYGEMKKRPKTAVNRQGYAHIAFAVEDVDAAIKAILEAGGGVVGKRVTNEVPGAGIITFAYVTDPEGNIIELQHWSTDSAATEIVFRNKGKC